MPKKTLLPLWLLLPLLAPLAGCSRNPNAEISGSFFPAWMISLLLGIAGAMLLWRLFLRRGIDPYLRPAPLVYGALALALTLLAWLLLYA